MADPDVISRAGPPRTQMPEWETPASYGAETKTPGTQTIFVQSNGRTGFREHVKQRLDRTMPLHRRYCGLKRRTLLVLIGILTVLLLALIIGLAAGLTRRSSSGGQYLPLPGDRSNFIGDLTYYGPGLGACGLTSTDKDNICSMSHFLWDSQNAGTNPNNNPLCGLKIRAQRYDEQVNAMRSVDLTVVDRCVGCAPNDLDVSPGVFDQLADPARGRVDVTWAWLSPAPTS